MPSNCRVQTNFVEVPFTVKDSKQKPVPGLHGARFACTRTTCRSASPTFTVDPFPLSVAIVIDQSLTFDNMAKVNNSLSALQGAFAPYDEVAVYTYNNGPQKRTDFTGRAERAAELCAGTAPRRLDASPT